MIIIPEWYKYVVWGYDEDNNPYIKGVRKDTPEELKRQFKQDMKDAQKRSDDDDDFRAYI